MRFLFACLLVACSTPETPSPEKAPPTGPLHVVASFYPLAYFAERIGGDQVKVEIITPADADPAHWQPDTAAIERLQRAELVLLNGANFERWASRVALPLNRTVDTTAKLEDRLLVHKNAIRHKHGSMGAHDHSGIDGHTWLDLELAEAQAAAVRDALIRARPDHRAAFERRFTSLATELRSLDTSLKALPATPVLANHPAYNYLARRLGWSVINFDLDPAAVPSPAQTEKIKARNAAHGAKILLWESAPSPAVEAHFAALGLRSVLFSPVERAPEKGDFIQAMTENLARLRRP